ncbi:MAG: ATP-binding cassette domain-containing protein [Coriobacteriales bacterium]|nr:ATP-binding cassette domain-containing protein [Coriobacteriales bacterium]
MESQIETRMRLDAEITERAFNQLAASVTDPNQAPFYTIDELEQVDGTARACLKYYGITPGHVSDSVRDPNERLDWLCRPSGTMRRKVYLTPGWHKNGFGAMVAKMDTGQSIALLPRSVHGFHYLEPGTGRKLKVTDEVAQHILPDAEVFYRPLPAKALTTRDLIQFLSRIYSRGDYLLLFFASFAVALIGLLPAWVNKVAFEVVAPSGQSGLILPIAALLLGVAVSTTLINVYRKLVMERVSGKLRNAAEAATFSRVLSLPTSFFKQYETGDLASRVASVTTLSLLITSILLGSFLSCAMSIIYIFQIGVITPSLALPAFAVVFLQAGLTVIAAFITRNYEYEGMRMQAKLSGTVTALLEGIQKIKLAGAEDRAFAKWAHEFSDLARVNYNRPTLVQALPAFVALIGLLGNILIYYLAGMKGVSVAEFMAFNVAYGQVTAAIMALAGIAGEMAQIRPLLDLTAPILEATPEIAEDKPSVENISGAIEVSGVAFRYSETSPYVLRDLSFKVRQGEYVAIVGKSGCGKSTIMRLLLGFETPERGSIFYGPYDTSKVDLTSLRQRIGVVMQDGKLFMGDILSNITISNPLATVDDAWAAAELAGIAKDIRKMPMGMQTLISESGSGISGGQRQRLMIARAVCGKRRILMLDEATSALDNITQKHVADALAKLKCTRIVVAHRLSTVKHCDRILVVDDGVIAEQGTYEELIAKNGIFAELVERQRLDKEG